MDEVLNLSSEEPFHQLGLLGLTNDAIHKEDDLEFLQLVLFYVTLVAATDREHQRLFSADSPLIKRLTKISHDIADMQCGNPPKVLLPAKSPQKPYQTKSGSPVHSRAITVVIHHIDLLKRALEIPATDASAIVLAELERNGCKTTEGELSQAALKMRKNRIANDRPKGSRKRHREHASEYELKLAIRTGLSLLYQDQQELNFLELLRKYLRELNAGVKSELIKRDFSEIVIEQIRLANGLYPSMLEDLRSSANVLLRDELMRK